MHSAVSLLSAHNVIVGIGVEEQWSSRSLLFDLGWVRFQLICLILFAYLKVYCFFYQASLEANGTLSRREAYALASVNLERLLGIRVSNTDLVAVKHVDLLGFEGEVIGIISPQRETVDLMQ